MITSVSDLDRLYAALDKKPDIYTEKIRSFAKAYGTGYPFCRFFISENTAICVYYGETAAAQIGDLSDSEADELSLFLLTSRHGKILMSYELCGRLGLDSTAEKLCLMRWDNSIKKSVEYNKEDIETDTPIGKVYEIAACGFDIDYDTWYTDISHMTRHGIAKTYSLGDAACAVRMFSSNGITYLSYICTRTERRGEGLAKRLVRGICEKEALIGNNVYVFCENGLEDFYKRVGFVRCGTGAQITTTGTV